MKTINHKTRFKIWNKYNKRCAYCGDPIEFNKMQVDHIHPQYLGGGNIIENFNPSCGSCNRSKATYTIEKWRNELELKKKRIVRDSANFRILQRFGIVKIIDEKITFYFENNCV